MTAQSEVDYLSALELLTLDPDSPTVQGIGSAGKEVAAAARPWISGPTVVGTGVTVKRVKGAAVADQLALVVYVSEKLPDSGLTADQRVPQAVDVPGDQQIVTDVVPIGELALQVNTSQTRPLLPGYSIGSINDGPGTGTLGCFVARVDNPGVPLVLSNSHVLARSGLAPADAPIVQPGKYDGGGAAEVIGTLVEAVPFDFTAGYNQLCDAAIARLNPGLPAPEFDIPGIGVPTYDPATVCEVGMQVQKVGRTSGHTIGMVRDIHFRSKLSYPKPGGGSAKVGFYDQVLCSRYTDGGDSGSLVCDMSGRAVGLHWCGSESASVFTPIKFVFDELRITLAYP